MSVNASDSRYFSFHMETRGWKWPPLRTWWRKSETVPVPTLHAWISAPCLQPIQSGVTCASPSVLPTGRDVNDVQGFSNFEPNAHKTGCAGEPGAEFGTDVAPKGLTFAQKRDVLQSS